MAVKVFFKKDTVSIVFGEDGNQMYFATFDYEFRLMAAYKSPNLYRRGFNNQILLGNVFSSESFFLTKEGSKRILQNIYEDAIDVFNSRNYRVELKQQSDDLVNHFIEKVEKTTFDEVILDGERFEELYKPINILPPDQYLSLYIPITEGCSYNKCSFCNLYKDRRFRIKTEGEINNFINKIVNYFGFSLLTRRGVFLGEGNALVEDAEKIIESIEIIKRELKQSKFAHSKLDDSFAGFMDTFYTKKTHEELKKLKERNLSKVFIGIESGSEYILNKLLMKPSNRGNLVQTLKNLKSVDINVGITVMVGVGGRELSEEHIKETLNLLFGFDLGENDIIYLSPIVEYPDLTYSKLMEEYNLSRLTSEEIKTQMGMMKESLLKRFPKTKVSIYRVDRFIY